MSKGARRFDAEDAASQAILQVATSATFDDIVADPWPYLATTTMRLAGECFRSEARAESVSRSARLVPRQRGIEEDIVSRDLARQALKRVRATESELVADMMLRRAGGLTWPEVFEEFGLTYSAGQSRIWRAQQRARRRQASSNEDLA